METKKFQNKLIFKFISSSQKTIRLLCLIAFCFVWSSAKSQSYYYFQNEIPTKNSVILNYKTLLVVQPDGNATARIQYNEGPDHKLFLYQVSLSDSVINQTDTLHRFLIPNGASQPLLDKDTANFFALRFIFEKKYDSSGYYYEPFFVEVKNNKNEWNPVKTTLSQLKTYEDLRNDEPFVSSFYFQSDEFYQYIFSEKTRGVVSPRKEKMFLIIVANTNDETVGKSAKSDLQNVSSLFNKLAENVSIKTIIPIYISGNDFNKASVNAAIAQLEQAKPTSDDIVIFYYSGHGFRLPGDKSLYPNISFRNVKNRKDNVVGDYLPLEDVYKRISALKPNVCLVLGDCCNANIYQNPVIGSDLIQPKGGGFLGAFNPKAAEKLFFPNAPVSMIIGSVEEDHLSLGNPQIGGYFTHFFTAELEKNLWGFYSNNLFSIGNQSNAMWLQILIAARKNTYWKSKSIQCGKTPNDRCIQQAVINIKSQ
ncbi:MAG: caspase family protein [Candidatus Sericytochromatia bacterium]|nr:caspase family protein [Candidatus Sericytochromatia bacterium]